MNKSEMLTDVYNKEKKHIKVIYQTLYHGHRSSLSVRRCSGKFKVMSCKAIKNTVITTILKNNNYTRVNEGAVINQNYPTR